MKILHIHPPLFIGGTHKKRHVDFLIQATPRHQRPIIGADSSGRAEYSLAVTGISAYIDPFKQNGIDFCVTERTH
jgi:hypothetical protein